MGQSSKYVFEKLTPISDSDLGIYKDALDFIFVNDDVRNVAISGSYGSGKSSVLESYKIKQQETGAEKKYVHVSLAHFSEDTDSDDELPVKESVLEGKILNQLLHQIPSGKIPQTNFKVKKSLKPWESIVTAIGGIILLLSALGFIFYYRWVEIVSEVKSTWLRKMFLWSATPEARLVFGIVAALIAGFFLFQLIRAQKNMHLLRKLSVQGNEIEIFEKTEESYFDKYLNEVLYLFENVDADVIVFEDMDRFDANRIFERLREVNTLANIQRKKENKGIIRFFYLLKDDIFVSKDRTKFFDYIVPIVPVVDGSNSYNQLISHFKKNDLFQEFDNSFLQGLSLYIDDMRLLKNICNEFLIYYNQLNTTELDNNKMLALISYKNLFPKDFSDLQLNKGFVYALFQKKECLIEEKQKEYEDKIKDNKRIIELAAIEPLESVTELDDVDNARQNRGAYGLARRDYQNWKTNVYPVRKRAIENKNAECLKLLEQENARLQQEKKYLSSLPLRALINRDNIDDFFRLESMNEIGDVEKHTEIKCNDYFPLIKYLIRNGYIDETYADYMTYFYEGSLSRTDKIYLRSITDKKAKQYSYELDNPQMVFDRLKPTDFDQEETLNNSLVDYMIKNAQNSDALSHLFEQLINTKKYDFIEQLLDSTKFLPDLIRLLGEKWPELFSDILLNGGMDSSHIRDLSIYYLYFIDDDSIFAVNRDNALHDYISAATDYLEIDSPKIERLINRFDLLAIYFPAIDYEKADKDLFKAVYENGNYVINFNNIKQMLSVFFGIDNEEDIRHKTSTLIFKHPDSPLANKVSGDMETFMTVVLDECEDKISDEHEIVLEILNNDSIQINQKEAYIERLHTIINDLSLVMDKELWRTIVEKKKVVFSEKTIVDYYMNTKVLDDTVVSFINDSSEVLDFSTLSNDYDSIKRELFDRFVKRQALSDKAYEHSVVSFGESFEDFNIDGISIPKMQILIDHSIIRMNEASLLFMRDHYPELMGYYIEQNIDEYVKIIDEEMFSSDELIEILSKDIPDEYKIALLHFSSDPISIQDKNYSESVQAHILINNLFSDDLPVLYSLYSQQSPTIQRVVYNYAANNIADIIEKPNIIDKPLKDELIRSINITQNQKVALLIADLPNLSREEVLGYLNIVGKEEFAKVFDSYARPRFEDNEQNRKLLDGFISHDWIYEYYLEGDYLKIRRNRPKL